ncbi:hypothetical protein OG204_21895 [Streptomyces sp. NBC_01387]|uniref:hypothetical protein n=1 Tax=unclassified Streptomyces TaxID=2593676 RepID=UPI002255C813|nr:MULTISPECIES: hypothetical protein [unclassified Streptomyces]MCX4549024.1 hypothetical protein [Streptomyces sp. NBC_01500]
MDSEVNSTDAVGVEDTASTPIPVERPRRWPGTIGTLVLAPLLLGCAWLAQRQGTSAMLLAVFLALIVLCTAWAMCGAGPGVCAATLGFVLLLFAGPALNDFVMNRRGVHHEGLMAGVASYHRKHGDAGHTCQVVRIDPVTGKPRTYSVDDSSGCSGSSKTGQRVILVEDPTGWLVPRLDSSVHGLSSGLAWTCGSLFAGMEAFVLYGRLRRRHD